MEWQIIRETIVQFLIDNPKGELETHKRRLRELEKIESQLPKEYVNDPTKLLSVNKKELISSLGIKSGAGTSIVNNIYDILNGKPLKTRRINNE